jgi:hypothetical protein
LAGSARPTLATFIDKIKDVASMAFPVIMVLLLWPIRKIGWMFSPFLYRINIRVCIILLTLWGIVVGFLVGILDWNLKPNIILKIIFGFFEGLYLSSPNFGLLIKSTVPLEAQNRHKVISHYPQAIFAIIVLVMFYLNTIYPKE